MSNALSALSEQGKPVDWWFVYKVPKIVNARVHANATGYEYFYFDPEIDKVILSENVLTDGKGALDLTLKSIFQSPADTAGWVLYNDEMPSDTERKDSGKYGHTKGVIAFDLASGTAVWLLHSWPKYACPHTPEMPTPEYGQTFLCLSMNIDTAGNIAAQMVDHQEPQVYTPRLPVSLDESHPLHLLTKNVDPNAKGDSSVLECTTLGGMPFKVIAKNRKWGKDFWNDLVGPVLKSDMDVETWIRGAIPPIVDSDGVHKVYDVKYIDFGALEFPYAWPETHDHAKWGLTVDSDWVCVGDINRMISQEKRGGGTVAFQNKTLWNALKKTDLLVIPPSCAEPDVRRCIRATHKVA